MCLNLRTGNIGTNTIVLAGKNESQHVEKMKKSCLFAYQINFALLIIVEDLDELHDVPVVESLQQVNLTLYVLLPVRDFPAT